MPRTTRIRSASSRLGRQHPCLAEPSARDTAEAAVGQRGAVLQADLTVRREIARSPDGGAAFRALYSDKSNPPGVSDDRRTDLDRECRPQLQLPDGLPGDRR